MNKLALITGASSGIGKELAKLHAKKSGDLVVVARSTQKLEELKIELEEKYKIKVYVICKDLTSSSAPTEIYNEVKHLGLEVDYLINNAGFGGRGKFHERKLEDDLNMIQVNIISLTALTRLFLSDFVKRNSGKILNVSSTAALMPGPLQAVYYATKSYVTFFSDAISEELKDTNITITSLMPGATETEFAKVSGMDKTPLFNNTFSAKDVAKDGYNGMIDGKLNVITGVTLSQKMMFKMLPITPKKMLLKQIHDMQLEK